MGGYGSSHWVGAGVGYALVFVTASAFVFLLPLMVGVLTWCEFSDKVDRGTIRSATDSALQDVNARVAELKDKAQTPAAPAAVPVAAAPVGASAPVAAHPSPRCPQCAGVVQADDRFCEHCGHKLQ